MTLEERIVEERNTAMKQRDAETLGILRILCAAIKNERIEQGKDLTDEQMQAVIARQVKQMKDALKDFESAGREDLIVKAQKEIQIAEGYLPEELSDENIKNVISRVIAEAGDSAQMGSVMGNVMRELKGRADGNRVRTLVSAALAK